MLWLILQTQGRLATHTETPPPLVPFLVPRLTGGEGLHQKTQATLQVTDDIKIWADSCQLFSLRNRIIKNQNNKGWKKKEEERWGRRKRRKGRQEKKKKTKKKEEGKEVAKGEENDEEK